jgi:hypothetical protein
VNGTAARDELLRAPIPVDVMKGWPYKWAVGVAAFSALAFAIAAVWSVSTKDPYPLGMAQVAGNAWYAWPLLALSVWALLVLLVERWRTPFNLIFVAGVLAGIGFTVMFFVGNGGVALVLTAGYLMQVVRGREF